MTFPPAPTNASATAKPMPFVPPVTNAFMPVRLPSMKFDEVKYVALAASFSLTIACATKSSDQPVASTPPEAQASASHATSAPPASVGAGESVQGQVLEKIDASSYTYVRVKTDRGEIWAATLPFK